MQRLALLLAIIVGLCAGSIAYAGCPGGQCGRPIRSIVSPRPTLALPARKHTASPVKAKEHSIVARRGFSRGPGLFARIRFAPQSRWR